MPEFISHLQGTPSWADLVTTDEQGALAVYAAIFGWVDEPNEMGLERLLISPNTRDQSQLRPIMEMLAEVVIPAVQS